MNLKFLAGLAVIIALVSGFAVVNLAKKTNTVSNVGERVNLYPQPAPPSIGGEVETSVEIADHSVETKVTIE